MTGSKKVTLKSFLILQTIQEKKRYRTDAITDSGLQLTEIVLRHFKKLKITYNVMIIGTA